jgi:hypothetical protein
LIPSTIPSKNFASFRLFWYDYPCDEIKTECDVMSGAGVALGRVAGDRWGTWAERAGGVILIALGAKILAEHTGYL